MQMLRQMSIHSRYFISILLYRSMHTTCILSLAEDIVSSDSWFFMFKVLTLNVMLTMLLHLSKFGVGSVIFEHWGQSRTRSLFTHVKYDAVRTYNFN